MKREAITHHPRLSLGARQLLTFLREKSGRNGYCWWKQETIAKVMERGLRTVNRQVSELVSAGLLKSERHGHGNHYSLCELSGQLAYRQPISPDAPVSAPVGASDTPNWRIATAPVSISEIKPEKLASSHASTENAAGSNCAGFAQEFLGLVNGHQAPAGGRMRGCSRLAIQPGPLLDAIAQVASDRGLAAGDVAALWAQRAPGISKRAGRPDIRNPDAWFRRAFLDELGKLPPRAHFEEMARQDADRQEREAAAAFASMVAEGHAQGLVRKDPNSACIVCVGFGVDIFKLTPCRACHLGERSNDLPRKLPVAALASADGSRYFHQEQA